VTDADRAEHEQFGKEIEAELMAMKPTGKESFEQFRERVKAKATQLKQAYQPKLTAGIKVDVEFIKSEREDQNSQSTELKIRIAPNNLEEIIQILKRRIVQLRTEYFLQQKDAGSGETVRPHEAEAFAEFEAATNSTVKVSDKYQGGDFIPLSGSFSGKVIDHLGSGRAAIASGGFELNQLYKSIDAHYSKAVDYILIDIRYLGTDQRKLVKEYVNEKSAKEIARTLYIE